MTDVVEVYERPTETLVQFRCPGCKCGHAYRIKGGPGPVWQWNGDKVKPTFSPSLLYTQPWGDPPVNRVCHIFVNNGMIQFLGDCTHDLAGKTVPMEPCD